MSSFLNGLHNLDRAVFEYLNLDDPVPWLDKMMQIISGHYLWLLVILAFFAVRKVFQKRWEFGFLFAGALGASLSDAISTFFLKPFFGRLRPCKDSEVAARIVEGCAGHFGFPSNHAANSMAICALMVLLIPGRWIKLILLVPVLISYSRIYLGMHYLLDVLAGMLLGSLVAICVKKIAAEPLARLEKFS